RKKERDAQESYIKKRAMEAEQEVDMEDKEATPVEDVESMLPPAEPNKPAPQEEQPEKSTTKEDTKFDQMMEMLLREFKTTKEELEELKETNQENMNRKKVEEEITVIEQKITRADERWSQTEREETREDWERVQDRFTEKCDGIEAAVTTRIEEYFTKHRGNRWRENKEVLDESFKEIADNWWMAIRDEVTDYQQFKRLFKAKYWSESTQNIARDGICHGKYNPYGNQTLTAYFLGKVCVAKHLEPRIPEECLVSKLSYHYEEDIIRARRNSQIKTVQAMTELLEMYEHEDYYRQSRRRYEKPEPRTEGSGQRRYQPQRRSRYYEYETFQGSQGSNRYREYEPRRSSSLDNQRRLPVTEAQQDDRAEPNEAVSGLQADASNGLIRNDAEHLNERR
ncbi:hypothetical protein L0F63_007209, partial [Massospora cicadina]